MTVRVCLSVAIALFTSAWFAPLALAGGAPVITGLIGNNAPTAGGSQLTIEGLNLVDSTGIVTVLIGGGAAPIESAGEEAIVVTVPEGQGANLDVRVFVGIQLAISPEPFSYAPPSIFDALPRFAPEGAEVFFTVAGDNFGVAPEVTAGGLPVTLVVQNHDVLGFYRPEGLEVGTYSIVIDVGGQTVSTPFEVTSADPVEVGAVFPSVWPASGGIEVDIFGTGFATDAQIIFDGAPAPTTFLSPERLTAIAPAGVGAGLPVRVQTRNRSSTLAGAYSYARPVIQGFGLAGDGQVDLTGTGFGSAPLVTVDGLAAPVIDVGADTLRADIPEGVGGLVGIVVTAGGQSSDAVFLDLGATGCADLNGDGVVNAADLSALIAAWGPCP